MALDTGIDLRTVNKYKNVIEHIDSYCLSCELDDVEMSCRIINGRETYYSARGFEKDVYIYVATVNFIERKVANGFIVFLNYRRTGNVRFEIRVPLESGLNVRKISANLKKCALSWDKSKDSRGNMYCINCTKEKYADVFNLFAPYLP